MDWETFIKTTFDLIGFKDYRLEVKPQEKHASLFIYEDQNLMRESLPSIVESINHLIQMVAKKHATETIFLDVNNYRQERENLIAELARAAAKKALATKEEVSLPAMNSYERRLVHVELAIHPEVRTESMGMGKERYVVIKPITDGSEKGSPAVPASETDTEAEPGTE
ncbi:MAG TPA: R3H domain-containing nucleic acid-binding protein [Candidatus Paceibacterota bacterium]|nr:R3H domain-containing nucleic acid-binding protein [Candidatus Paceibacterota bacterium]